MRLRSSVETQRIMLAVLYFYAGGYFLTHAAANGIEVLGGAHWLIEVALWLLFWGAAAWHAVVMLLIGAAWLYRKARVSFV